MSRGRRVAAGAALLMILSACQQTGAADLEAETSQVEQANPPVLEDAAGAEEAAAAQAEAAEQAAREAAAEAVRAAEAEAERDAVNMGAEERDGDPRFDIDKELGRTPFGLTDESDIEPRRLRHAEFTGPIEQGRNVTSEYVTITSERPIETIITAGRRVTATFTASAPAPFDAPAAPCTVNYRLEVEESDAQVQAWLYRSLVLAPDAHTRDCPPPTDWAITTRLQTPLGQRALIDQPFRRYIQVVQVEARLSPTELPPGWVALTDDERLPIQTHTYGIPDEQEIITVETAMVTSGSRANQLWAYRDAEPVTIKNRDGDVLVDGPDGVIVGFEEQGWYYKVTGSPAVNTETVLDFARSFARPAFLLDEPSPEFVPLDLADPQPGQEEREARPLQGVLPGQ